MTRPLALETGYMTPAEQDPGGKHQLAAGKRLLSVDELSAYLSLPKATIYSWASLRRIPGIVKLGRALRFEKEAIDRWVDQAKSEPRRRGGA